MQYERSQSQVRSGVTYDVGLRSHMLRIYNRMTLGVFITALTAAVVSSSPALLQLFLGGPQRYIVIFAPLAIVWFGFNPMTMSARKLQTSFLLISVLYGISFAVIFLVYTQESIARAFFIASGMFAGLSIFGYTTKKNLDAFRTFIFMGVMGVVLMSVVNMFIRSEGLFDLISLAGIVVFAGLTAWQTQSMKKMYSASNGEEANSRMAWAAALNLYISFIVMFQYILHFVGNRS